MCHEMITARPGAPHTFVTEQNTKSMKALNRILMINSLTSGATGLLMFIFSSSIAELFDVTSTAGFTAVGVFLIAFAALVFAESRADQHNISRVRLIIFLDMLWVCGSVIILLVQPFGFSAIGNIATAAVALWVAAMAYFQSSGLKQLQRS